MKKITNIIKCNLALLSLLFVNTAMSEKLDLKKAGKFAEDIGGKGTVVEQAQTWIVFGVQAIGWAFIVAGVVVPAGGIIKAFTMASSGTKTDWTIFKAIGLGFLVFVICALVGITILSFV